MPWDSDVPDPRDRPPPHAYLCLSTPGFHTLRSVDPVLLTVRMLCAYPYETLEICSQMKIGFHLPWNTHTLKSTPTQLASLCPTLSWFQSTPLHIHQQRCHSLGCKEQGCCWGRGLCPPPTAPTGLALGPNLSWRWPWSEMLSQALGVTRAGEAPKNVPGMC